MFRYSKPHPSRPSTDDSKQPLPSQIPLYGYVFSLLSSFCDLAFFACANVWICLFVLVLPSRPFALRSSFCPSCGLARTAKIEMKHKPQTRQHEMPESPFHTPHNQETHLPDEKEPRSSPITPKHCAVCSNSLETGLWTGHVGYGAHSPAPDTPANTP